MKIESKIRREGGTHVDLFGRDWHFKPLDPTDPNSPHVCNVTDQNAVDRLMEIPEGYAPYGEDVAKPVTRPGSGAQTDMNKAHLIDGAGGFDEAKVEEISALSIGDLKAVINTYAEADLLEALAREQAAEKPRKGFIEAIEAHTAPVE